MSKGLDLQQRMQRMRRTKKGQKIIDNERKEYEKKDEEFCTYCSNAGSELCKKCKWNDKKKNPSKYIEDKEIEYPICAKCSFYRRAYALQNHGMGQCWNAESSWYKHYVAGREHVCGYHRGN